MIILTGCASSPDHSYRGDSGYQRRQQWNEQKNKETRSIGQSSYQIIVPVLWWTW